MTQEDADVLAAKLETAANRIHVELGNRERDLDLVGIYYGVARDLRAKAWTLRKS